MNDNILDKSVLAYITGVALGDGNLSNPNGRAVRLRVSCDTKYKNLILNICNAIKKLLPSNKVSLVTRKGKNCVDVSCYSNKWEKWLGWQANGGSKYKQNTSIPTWIKKDESFSIECLRGLLQTDGTIYKDRSYKAVMFVSNIERLANDVFEIIKKLGYEPHIYKIYEKKNSKFRFNVRLSKNVENFISLVNFTKN